MALEKTLLEYLQKSRDVAFAEDATPRRLAAGSPAERATAICREIDETMLARKLTFTVGTSARLVLDAGGRRVMRIIDVLPATIAPPGDRVFNMRNEVQLAEQFPALGRILAAICFHQGELHVTSNSPDGLYPSGAVGYAPEQLLAATEKAAKDKPAEPAVTVPVAATAVPAPPPEPPKPAAKFSPTDAMKAMIREKVMAATSAAAATAAINPGPAKALQTGTPKRPTAMPKNSLRAFFNEIENDVTFCAILNEGGNVEAVGGKDSDERILAFASDVISDLDDWRHTTTRILSSDQLIVLKANGIQNQSFACFSSDKGAVIAIFANTDLSRIFTTVNKIILARQER